MISNFSFVRRNFGHWDIYGGDNDGRLFRIRGGPGYYRVIDERTPRQFKECVIFNTLQAAVSFITDHLMYELIVAEGQEPIIIEGWNVT